MSDELLPQAGNEAAAEQASATKEESELKRARDEAAKYRKQFSELNAKWKETEPVLAEYQKLQDSQKTEAQKAQERVADMERQLAEKTSAAERAVKEAKLIKLATKAGIDPDVAELLDLSKLDLEDEKATLEKLGKLVAAKQTANAASNPGRNGATEASDKELRALYFGEGRNKPMIFGGD